MNRRSTSIYWRRWSCPGLEESQQRSMDAVRGSRCDWGHMRIRQGRNCDSQDCDAFLTVLKFRTVTSQVQVLEAAIEDSNASGGAPPQSAWESRPLAVAMSTKPHSSHPWKLEIRTSSPSDFIICLLDYLLRIPTHYLCRTKLHRPTLPNPQTHTFIQKEERGQEIHSALRLEYRLYTLQFRAWASRVPTTISQHERQILGLACKSSKCTKTTVVQPCPFDESCVCIDSQY